MRSRSVSAADGLRDRPDRVSDGRAASGSPVAVRGRAEDQVPDARRTALELALAPQPVPPGRLQVAARLGHAVEADVLHVLAGLRRAAVVVEVVAASARRGPDRAQHLRRLVAWLVGHRPSLPGSAGSLHLHGTREAGRPGRPGTAPGASARIETAISAGVVAPMSSPAGPVDALEVGDPPVGQPVRPRPLHAAASPGRRCSRRAVAGRRPAPARRPRRRGRPRPRLSSGGQPGDEPARACAASLTVCDLPAEERGGRLQRRRDGPAADDDQPGDRDQVRDDRVLADDAAAGGRRRPALVA